MTAERATADEILVAARGDHAFVSVRGHGTHRNAPSLRAFGARMIERGVTDLVVDLDRCRHLDSTFMGVLLGLSRDLRERCGGSLRVINLSPENRSLFATLGLDRVLVLCEASEVLEALAGAGGAGAELPAVDPDRRMTLETMLEAHRDLSSVSPENAARFEDVIAFLEEEARGAGG